MGLHINEAAAARAWNARAPHAVAAQAAPAAVAPVLDSDWRLRMLDGAAIERDEMGCGEHPALPTLEDGMKPKQFFDALGIELQCVMAEDQMDMDAYEAMVEVPDYNAWTPGAPDGEGWKQVAIFDTEDGPACWWIREAPPSPRIRHPRNTTAAVAAPEWDKVRRGLTMLMLGFAGRTDCTESAAEAVLDAATEPGMPLEALRAALAATPALPATEDSSAGDLAEVKIADEMCREERMIVLQRDSDGTPTVWCDPEIADIVSALNSGGVKTVASCSGHGVKPGGIALADGRQLLLLESLEAFNSAMSAITQAEVQAEPVAWMRKTDITELTDSEPETNGWTPLYVAPQAQPADALDAARLMFLMDETDGFVIVEKDKYDFAIECAVEAGREEPTAADELNGVRRLLDAAMAAAQEGGKA